MVTSHSKKEKYSTEISNGVTTILSDATLLSDGYILPKAISTVKFQDWLADCRAAMPDFQDKRIKISITKNL